MADKKISQLTSVTIPLDGTEVLPIVQGTTTKKVANNDLRPKQIQSNATSGVLQVTGPTAASTRVMTTPDANFTVARTDAANSFTADQTLATGNLVIGTSGKGIDFSATAGTGTSELLNDYEEGTWTPVYSGDGGNPTVTYSTQSGTYTKIGRVVYVQCTLVIDTTSGGSGQLRIGGLPYTSASNNTSSGMSNAFVYNFAASNNPQQYNISSGLNTITLYRSTYANTLSQVADLQASAYLYISGCYTV